MLYNSLPHVERNKVGKYTYYYYRPAGKRQRIRLKDPVRNSEEDCMHSYLQAKQTIRDFPKSGKTPKSVRLSKAFKAFLKAKSPTLSETTLKRYQAFARRICAHFNDCFVAQVTEPAFDAFILAVKGPQSANKLLSFAHQAWQWFKSHHLIYENPISNVSPREIRQGNHKRWTEREVKRFKDHWRPQTWERQVLDILLYTGARISDAMDLDKSNIFRDDSNQDCLEYVSKKTQTRITMHLNERLKAEIGYVIKENRPFVYNPRTGKKFKSYKTFYRRWKKACLTAGVNKTTHGLRKTVATRLANSGKSANEIMAMLGWKNLKTAEIYVKEADRRRLGISTSYDYSDQF